MKKGCFINFVITITILIGAALYIIQNKLDEIFIDPGKQVLTDFINDELENKLFCLKNDVNRDSLKKLVHIFADNFDDVKDGANDNADAIIESFKIITSDSLISNNELSEFKNLIMSIVYERPEKN